MKLLPIGRGEITRGQLGFSVVPVIRGIMTAPSRAGSRARTKTAACGAANRGFESHPARHLKLSRLWRESRLSFESTLPSEQHLRHRHSSCTLLRFGRTHSYDIAAAQLCYLSGLQVSKFQFASFRSDYLEAPVPLPSFLIRG